MFDQLTEQARQVMLSSRNEAKGLGHNYIGTEHVLLGLLGPRGGDAARVLGGLGVTIKPVRDYVGTLVESQGGPVSDEIPFTPRVKRVMERALREALLLGDSSIDVKHLLIGLAREAEGIAARILCDFGISVERIREALESPTTGPAARAEAQGAIAGAAVRVTTATALERAVTNAREQQRSVDLGDLLLSLTEGWPQDAVALTFRELGVSAARVRQAIRAVRGRRQAHLWRNTGAQEF